MIQVVKDGPGGPRIVVVGVGGAGCHAVDHMYEHQLPGVTFLVINTDQQELARCKTENQLHIGAALTGGMGTGADPQVGRECAEHDREALSSALEGADLVFIIAGLGRGTGTGAAPVVADIVKKNNALSVAIVTKPFAFEGPVRRTIAEQGQENLRKMVDTLITVPNEKVLKIIGDTTSITEFHKVLGGVLAQYVQSFSDLITQTGLINLDFAAIRTIMKGNGGAAMGVGFGKGASKTSDALQQASSSPLMEEVVIEGARGVLINISCAKDVTLHEVDKAITEHITSKCDQNVNILFGIVVDESMQDEMKVTILATGASQAASRLNAEVDAGSEDSDDDSGDLRIPSYRRLKRTFEEQTPVDSDVDKDAPVVLNLSAGRDHDQGAAYDEPLPGKSPSREVYEDFVRRSKGRGGDNPPPIFGTSK